MVFGHGSGSSRRSSNGDSRLQSPRNTAHTQFQIFKRLSVLLSASDTRRRGVALHADARGTSLATTTDFEVKRLQKGPRIERR
eukprot:6230962-Pyramimonas_sp.AAC.1